MNLKLPRKFLKLPIFLPFPSGMRADPSANFGLEALLSNANAYAEEAVTITTTGTDTVLTPGQVLKKNLVLDTGASGGFTLTLPSTSRIIDALGPTMPRNGTFYFPVYVNNASGQTATLTAGDGSTTFVGSAAVTNGLAVKWIVNLATPTTLVFTRVLTTSSSAGSGTVTSVSVTTQLGVSATVTNPTTTPALAFVLGAIVPSTVNGLSIVTTTGVLSITNGKTLTVSDSTTLGTNSITFGGTQVFSLTAVNNLAFTTTGATALTLPTSGTLMANPMTTGGDVIYGGASGLPTRLANGSNGQVLTSAGGTSAPTWTSVVGTGSVTTVSVTTANGVSGSVANATTTPAITLTLGAITPTTVNGLTITATTSGVLTVANSKTLTVSDSTTLATNSITFGGTQVFSMTAVNNIALTTTGATALTLPTSGTLAILGANTFTGKQTAPGWILSTAGFITDATTTRTLSATDNGCVIYFTNSGAITLSMAGSLGAFSCTVLQGAAGQITFAANSQTMTVANSATKTSGAGAMALILSPASGTFLISGTLA